MDFTNYVCDGQLSLFDIGKTEYKIKKPIRLIELFAGVGSQAMALRDIGADFEHYRVVEFDKYAIASYNAIHGTNFPTIDVTKIKGNDLGIVDCDKFTYLLTYSFPCTDLSVAGKMLGMAEGSGTRSSLLWEVKRLLDESDNLPQVLLMENVPQVHSKSNMPHFQKWIDYLDSKGYSTYWQDMNAKNYGVAQSRNRTFAVSILGNYNYTFPNPYPFNKVMKDYLEPYAEDKYYLKSEKARDLIEKLIIGGKLNVMKEQIIDTSMIGLENGIPRTYEDIMPTLSAREFKEPRMCTEINVIGQMDNSDGTFESANRVYGLDGIAPTIPTCAGGNIEPKVMTICAMRGREPMFVGTKEIGYIEKGTGKHQSNVVYAEDGLSPTICASYGVKQPPAMHCEINVLGNYMPSEHDASRVVDTNGVAPTVKENHGTVTGVVEVKQATKDGYIHCDIGGVADLNYPNSTTRRGRVIDQGNVSPTLTTENIPSVLEPWIWEIDGVTYLIRIRKLTPKECWRLMDFTDADFEKAEEVNSNTQLYKQAGNSIVKNVLCEIFKRLL